MKKAQEIDLTMIQEAVDTFLNCQNEEFVQSVFNDHAKATEGKWYLDTESFTSALTTLGVRLKSGQSIELFKMLDVDSNQAIDFEEFKRAIFVSSELENWLGTIPLAKLLACCLPSSDGTMDGIREFIELPDDSMRTNLEKIASAFGVGLQRLLKKNFKRMKEGYTQLRQRQSSWSKTSGNEDCFGDKANSKFNTDAKVGNIEDYHQGIRSRIGSAEMILHIPQFLSWSFTIMYS